MSPPREAKLPSDVVTSCAAVERAIGGRDPASALNERLICSAVLYELMIVGEALNQAIKLEPGLDAEIEHAPQIIAFRNRIVHGYDVVLVEKVALVIQKDLGKLSRQVRAAMAARGITP